MQGSHRSLVTRGCSVLFSCLLLLLLINACAPTSPSATGSLATPVPQPPTPLPTQHPLADIPRIAHLPGGTPLAANLLKPLSFTLLYNDNALEQAIQQIYTPGSPNFHHYLTPNQIRQSYGPSDSQVRQVQTWLTKQGFTSLSIDAMHSTIEAMATVATIEQSLQIHLQQYNIAGHQFFLPLGTPTLPGSITPFVQSVIGLNDFGVLHSFYAQPPLARSNLNSSAANCAGYGSRQTLKQTQLASAYQVDKLYQRGLQGQGMSIGIAEFAEPYDLHDVATYAACAGLGALHIQNVNVQGTLPAGPGEGEAAMDVELIAGLAPRAQILVYQSDQSTPQAMLTLFSRVASDHKVQVFSVSYGGAEGAFSVNEQVAMNRILRMMAGEGISAFISSGDCGAFGQRIQNIAVVSFPASAPYAIAVGGTHLQVDQANKRLSEDTWGSTGGSVCSNDWGSGGGVTQSQQFRRPSWQVGYGTSTHYDGSDGAIFTPDLIPVTAPNGLRQIPDIAAAAYPNLSIYYSGRWLRAGGTSAAAPIWAAGTLLIDQGLTRQHRLPLGGVPELYNLANHPRTFHPYTDITAGNNMFYNATRGWDYTTGWGSPNFDQILQLELAR